MSNKRFLGVDPGISGALCCFDPATATAQFFDTPTVTIKVGKKMKNQMDVNAIVFYLRELQDHYDLRASIEKVNAMPRWDTDPKTGQKTPAAMGVTSAFNFGFGFGLWIGVLTALGVPFQQVHPNSWKRRMMPDSSKEKDASRVKAMQLFPKTAVDLKLKRHHNRADALLIAAYGVSTFSALAEMPERDEDFEEAPALF